MFVRWNYSSHVVFEDLSIKCFYYFCCSMCSYCFVGVVMCATSDCRLSHTQTYPNILARISSRSYSSLMSAALELHETFYSFCLCFPLWRLDLLSAYFRLLPISLGKKKLGKGWAAFINYLINGERGVVFCQNVENEGYWVNSMWVTSSGEQKHDNGGGEADLDIDILTATECTVCMYVKVSVL